MYSIVVCRCSRRKCVRNVLVIAVIALDRNLETEHVPVGRVRRIEYCVHISQSSLNSYAYGKSLQYHTLCSVHCTVGTCSASMSYFGTSFITGLWYWNSYFRHYDTAQNFFRCFHIYRRPPVYSALEEIARAAIQCACTPLARVRMSCCLGK